MAHVKKTYASLSRMPAKLSKPLENGIAAYALAAGAAGVATLALVTPAEAAPVCKILSAELTYTATFAFDPANQPVAPFNIAQSFQTVSQISYSGVDGGFFTRNLPGAEVAVSSKGLVADLAPGARIGPGGQFGKGRSYGLIFTLSPWYGGTSQNHRGNLRFGQINYFGFRFLISRQAHYGWVRLESTVITGEGNLSVDTKIKAYGYESTANKAILAGSCSTVGESARRDSAPSSGSATAPGAKRTNNATQPASLGALALGARGISLWR